MILKSFIVVANATRRLSVTLLYFVYHLIAPEHVSSETTTVCNMNPSTLEGNQFD